MGSQHSKQSKETKTTIKTKQNKEISRVINNISDVQKQVLAPQNQLQNTQIIKREDPGNVSKKNTILKASIIAQEQLQKGGNTFTKDDMVSILLFIKTASSGNNEFNNLKEYSKMSRENLVNEIRTIIYDPTEINKLNAFSQVKPVQNHDNKAITKQ